MGATLKMWHPSTRQLVKANLLTTFAVLLAVLAAIVLLFHELAT